MCHSRASYDRSAHGESTAETEHESRDERETTHEREGLVARTRARVASLFETEDEPGEPIPAND
ncbi:hypothetical protein [Haladaptatus sp. NG-WS-4]